MFSFLNTSILFAAAAALIPLIIHLFSKRKVKVIEFSSVRHLKAMQKRQVRKLKIRQLLLLLLRMLIIFVVVLAFARPTTESGTIGSHAAVSAVVLFDNSVSMNRYVTDGNLYDIAKKRTADLLNNFGESDQVMLLPLAENLHENITVAFSSAQIAIDQLELLPIVYEKADLNKSMEHAVRNLSGAANLNKELYIVTDLQRYSLPDTVFLETLDATVYFVELPLEENENCGIKAVDFGGQLIIPGHDFQISATVGNQGNESKNDLIASLIIDGNRIAQTSFSVKGNTETVVSFIRSVSTTGFHSGYVEISDDKFPADNRYYFSFRIPDQFNLLIIDGDNIGELLQLALTPSQAINQYWSVKRATVADLAAISFWDYDVIFLSGAPTLPKAYIQRLKSFLSQGRSLFVSYDGQTDTAFFNKNYAELTAVTITEPARLDFTRAGYYSFLSYEATHPIFSIFKMTDNKPPEIKFYTLPKTSVDTFGKTLMKFTGDRPALVEANYKSGRVLTFAGPIAPNYTDLPGSAFFVPFLSRIAEYLASDLSAYDMDLYSGHNINRPLSDRISINDGVQLITPDLAEYQLVPTDKNGSLTLAISQAVVPGIYQMNFNRQEIDRFAININPLESDLTSVDINQFSAAIGTASMLLLKSSDDISESLAELRFGSELWQLFLWLALVLLAIEMLLSRSGASKED